MDQADFDPYEIDADGLPLVYNEERIASFWKGKPGGHLSGSTSPHFKKQHFVTQCLRAGELTSRWARFAAVSGRQKNGYMHLVLLSNIVRYHTALLLS